ncbi:MAG: InlB B-repeat-containing protein, partial [Bacilli bacterium]|nr:InlB B-repeat-containing protein [Bacilli bacterium]
MKKKFVIVIIMICFILTGCVNKSNYDNLNTNNKIDDNIQTEEKQISPKKGTIEEKEYKVKFDTDGGSDIESQTVKENLLITEPNAPTKSGYVFK